MIINYPMETRETHPNLNYETRRCLCPDGMTRLVTLTQFAWKWFDKLNQDENESEAKTIAFCWNLAKDNGYYAYDSFVKIMHYNISVYRRTKKAAEKGKSMQFSMYFNTKAQKAPKIAKALY